MVALLYHNLSNCFDSTLRYTSLFLPQAFSMGCIYWSLLPSWVEQRHILFPVWLIIPFLWEEMMMVLLLHGYRVKPIIISKKSKFPTRTFNSEKRQHKLSNEQLIQCAKSIILLYLCFANMVFIYLGSNAPHLQYHSIAPR